jgi:glutamate formiminotransferase / 5-formyltetrahydrofolate cyclo-ligase
MRMPGPLIQSAINVSEGRRAPVIAALVEAARSAQGVTSADWSADPDHNRMVLTLLGGPDAIRRGALAVARVAVAEVDLRQHTGGHPRIGAVDVIPLAPVRNVTIEDCQAVATQIAADLAEGLGLPIYYYERSAPLGRRAALPEIRKGGFEGLFTEELTGLRAPDVGPAAAHPTAGAVVVGARGPLVAYNIDLDSSDVALARRIAAAIRRERSTRPELVGVRALGLWLPSRGVVQISMNLTMPTATPMPRVFDFVREQAQEEGVAIRDSEVIGLIPAGALGGEPPERILWRDFRETQILDHWLERL